MSICACWVVLELAIPREIGAENLDQCPIRHDQDEDELPTRPFPSTARINRQEVTEVFTSSPSDHLLPVEISFEYNGLHRDGFQGARRARCADCCSLREGLC